MEDEQAQQQNQRSISKDVARSIGKQGAKKILRKVGGKAAKRLAAQGLRVAATEGIAALAGATSEFWVPVLIIGLIGITFFIVLFGGASVTVGGDLSNNSSPVPDASYAPFSGNVDDYFTISDISGKYGWLVQELKNNLAIALAYPKYPSMLKGNVKITIDDSRETGPIGGGWAETDSSGNISVYNKYITTDPTTRKIYIIHETGHTIAYRNGNAASFYSTSTKDTACYDSDGYIKTYPTAFHQSSVVQHQQESFADSLVNTIFCKAGKICPATGGVSGEDGPINDWQNTCSNTYNWMIQNVLDGNNSSTPNQSPLPSADLTEIKKYVNIGYLPNSNSNGKCFAQTDGKCDGSFDGLILTDSEKNYVYNIFKKLLRSQRYKDRLGNSPINLYFFTPLSGCKTKCNSKEISGGAGYGATDMAFFGYFRNGASEGSMKQIMIHESAHILDKRKGENQLGMDLSFLNKRDGSACYDYNYKNPSDGLYYLKTYAYRNTVNKDGTTNNEGANAGPRKESFAEAVADTVTCVSGYPCSTDYGHAHGIFIDFPKACPNTRKWIIDNVFDGVDVSQY